MSYGYAILKQVNELSGGQLEWTDGLLYPLLHRLERLGHVESAWEAPPGDAAQVLPHHRPGPGRARRAAPPMGRGRRRPAGRLEHDGIHQADHGTGGSGR